MATTTVENTPSILADVSNQKANNVITSDENVINNNCKQEHDENQNQMNDVESCKQLNPLQQQQQSILSASSSVSSTTESSSQAQQLQPLQSSILMDKLELIHPLEHQWSFWYLKNQPHPKDWQDNLMKIATFGYVEEFWALYNHLRVATRIPPGCDYMLFKSSVLPCWEDQQNAMGGRWVLYFSKSEQILLDLDVCWLASMLALIGGQYAKDTMYVNGVVLSARKSCDRIALWTSICHSEQLVHRIGRRMRELINIPRSIHILFELHNQENNRKKRCIK